MFKMSALLGYLAYSTHVRRLRFKHRYNVREIPIPPFFCMRRNGEAQQTLLNGEDILCNPSLIVKK